MKVPESLFIEGPLIARYIAPYRGGLLIGLLLSLFSSAVALVIPLIAGKFAEVLVTGISVPAISTQTLLFGLLAIFAIRSLLSYVSSVVLAETGEALLMNMREDVYRHIQDLPLPIIRQHSRGDIISLFSNDIPVFAGFMVGTAVGLLPTAFTFFGALAFIFYLNATVALLALLLVPVFLLAIKLLSRSIRPTTTAMYDEMAKSISLIEENVDMMPLIKSVDSKAQELQNYRDVNAEIIRLHRHNVRLQTTLSPLVQFCGMTAIVILLWFAASDVTTENMSIGELVTLILYGTILAGPAASLANVYGSYQSTRPATERILEVLDEQPEAVDTGEPISFDMGPTIEFQDVAFSYKPDEPVFKRFNLSINAGETLVIAGPNGVGKSTMIDLLLGFLTPEQGRILINGKDLGDLKLSDVRRQIGLVYQDARLFNRSIEANLTYGNASIHIPGLPQRFSFLRFIQHLGAGLATISGERGDHLSGGQKQRISLGRVLASAPPIIIFDEATSMMDPQGQSQWLDECAALLKDRTVIIVSHDPNLIARADRVVHLADGDAD